MAYLVLLLPALVLPVLVAMAAFEARCGDRAPLLRRRAAPAVDVVPAPVPAPEERA